MLLGFNGPAELVLTTEQWGWASIAHPHPGVHEQHLLPLMDTGCHAFDMSCPCGPVLDCPGSVVHTAFDGRQFYEQGLAKRH